MNHIVESFVGSRKWAKIVAVFFMVMFALQVLSGFVSFLSGLPGVIMGIIMIAMGVFFYLLPGLYLQRYAGAVAEAEENVDNPVVELEEACLQQGKYFKLIGIVTLVMIILAVVGGILMAIAMPAYIDYLGRAGMG